MHTSARTTNWFQKVTSAIHSITYYSIPLIPIPPPIQTASLPKPAEQTTNYKWCYFVANTAQGKESKPLLGKRTKTVKNCN